MYDFSGVCIYIFHLIPYNFYSNVDFLLSIIKTKTGSIKGEQLYGYGSFTSKIFGLNGKKN